MFKKRGKSLDKASGELGAFGNELSASQDEVNKYPESEDKCILKSGYFKKLKTMKKKFFVLLSSNEKQDAQLQYYDTEKKYFNQVQPKRVIILKDCFVINRRNDIKQQFAISLYTIDDCFTIVFENESLLEEWLQLMLKLQMINRPDESEPLPNFDYIWQVTIKNKGLAGNKKMTGQYRLCLSFKSLILMKMGVAQRAENSMEFPLLIVRRCGHSDALFFMELGRSAVTGAGELWMQTEDSATAQHMHEAILSAMKSSNSMDDSSLISKTSRARRSTASIFYSSDGSLQVMRSSTGSFRADNCLDGTMQPTFRQRTVSEGQHSLSKGRNKKLGRFLDSDRSYYAGHKSLSFSDDSFPRNYNTNSMSKNQSSSNEEINTKTDSHLSSSYGMSSMHKTEPTISEEGEAVDDYLSMNPAENNASNEYIPMDPASSSTPCKDLNNSLIATSSSRKADISKLPSDEPYVEMESSAGSPAFSQSNTDVNDGYLLMSSGLSVKCNSPSSSLTDSMLSNDGYMNMSHKSTADYQNSGFHHDKVKSCISDFSDCEDFPSRSYSVGAANKSKFLSNENYRTRAFSCGSHDDAAKTKMKGMKADVINKIRNQSPDDGKSSSAPHLVGQRSHTYGGSQKGDLMELEFMPESVSGTCSQSSSHSSISGRSRSGSKSSSSRNRILNTRYRTCDTCEPSALCLCLNSSSYEGSSPSGRFPHDEYDKFSHKMSPSQELVQHLNISEKPGKYVRDEESQLDASNEAGDYINIDISYVNKDFESKSRISDKSSTDGKSTSSSMPVQNEYMNMSFEKDEKSAEPSISPTAEIRRSGLSETDLSPAKKPQSSPTTIPKVPPEKSPHRKISCPVYSPSPDITLLVDRKIDRKYSLDPPFSCKNISFPNQKPVQSPFSSRPSSIGNETVELNYAALDLESNSCEEDDHSIGKDSPRPSICQSSVQTSVEEIKPQLELSYAKIDFTKSEVLRTTTTTVVESRH